MSFVVQISVDLFFYDNLVYYYTVLVIIGFTSLLESEADLTHVLSWRRNCTDVTRSSEKSHKVTTRLWIPSLPTQDDMNFLNNPEPLTYPDIPEPYVY